MRALVVYYFASGRRYCAWNTNHIYSIGNYIGRPYVFPILLQSSAIFSVGEKCELAL